jgi:peptide/nickel transport system substrate-binding protein
MQEGGSYAMTHRYRRLIAVVAVLALAVGMLAGCGTTGTGTGTGTTGTTPVKGGTLTIGYEQEPSILNSFITGGDMMSTKDVQSNVLLGLVRIKPDFTYEPMIAESIPEISNGLVTENPFTVTWKLKKNAVWSDGVPITADDVKFTFDTIMNPKLPILSKSGYEEITKAEVIDPQTIKLTFKTTYAPYRELFSASYMILPKHALEGKDFATVMNESIPVASGPFMFKEWKKGDHISLVRNDKYFGTPAWLDGVVFKWIPDVNTEIAQMKTGEVDAVNPSPDPALIDQLKTTTKNVMADPGTVWEHLAFNLTKPDISDLKVRQAIAYTIDRTKIVDQVMLGQVKPLNDIFVPEQAAYYSSPWAVYTPDPAKAEGLLASAGYAKGADGFYAKGGKKLTLEFKTTAGNTGREKMFQILQSQLKAVGIDVKLTFEDASVFFGTSTTNGKFQVGEWAWVASPDPSVKTLFSTEQIPPTGQNYYRYKNADVTKWINEADNALDLTQRAALSKQISAQMAKDLPLIPLYQRLSILAVKDYVHDAKNNATLEGAFWNLGEWWMEAGSGSGSAAATTATP